MKQEYKKRPDTLMAPALCISRQSFFYLRAANLSTKSNTPSVAGF
jgi:hypothetical protein